MSKRIVCAGLVLAGIAMPSALMNGQAPNQASLVTQTVAGVKFSTLPGFAIERMNPPALRECGNDGQKTLPASGDSVQHQ